MQKKFQLLVVVHACRVVGKQLEHWILSMESSEKVVEAQSAKHDSSQQDLICAETKVCACVQACSNGVTYAYTVQF